MNQSEIKRANDLLNARTDWKRQREQVAKEKLTLTVGEEQKMIIVLTSQFQDALHASVLKEMDRYIEVIEKQLTELGVEFS